MILSHKIQLRPTPRQVTYFSQACGVSRFTYNWALARYKAMLDKKEKPNLLALKREFNAIYHKEFPWVGDVLRDAHSQPFANLQNAVGKFFKKTAKFPVFKSKHGSKQSFYVANDKFKLTDKRIQLPHIGKVRMTENLRFAGKIMSARVSCVADRWFVSISVATVPVVKPKTGHGRVGIDLGLKTSVTCSDGRTFQSPKPLRKRLRRLKHLSRGVSRKQKGSANRRKAVKRLAREHHKVACIRNDFLQKTTTTLARSCAAIAIEDLNVKGMQGNRKLARAIADQGWSEFGRQLGYKQALYGFALTTVDRFYPSSKTCSNCGTVKTKLALNERTYNCDVCGFSGDRDLNAAVNLSKQLPGAPGNVKPVEDRNTEPICVSIPERDPLKQEPPGVHLVT